MNTPEDVAAQRKRVNAALAQIRRAEREDIERQRELLIGGVPSVTAPLPLEPVEWHVGGNDQDIPLRWFAIGFVILMLGMGFIMALA